MAGRAVEYATIMDIVQRTGKSPFCTVLPQDRILIGSQGLLPFRIRFNNAFSRLGFVVNQTLRLINWLIKRGGTRSVQKQEARQKTEWY